MLILRIVRFICHFSVIVALSFLFVGCGGEKDEFLAALARVPRSNVDLASGITGVVQKQFPSGTDLQATLLFLEQRGFRVFPNNERAVPPGQKWFIAERHASYKVIHTETIRVIVESDGKRVLKVRGLVFLS